MSGAANRSEVAAPALSDAEAPVLSDAEAPQSAFPLRFGSDCFAISAQRDVFSLIRN